MLGKYHAWYYDIDSIDIIKGYLVILQIFINIRWKAQYCIRQAIVFCAGVIAVRFCRSLVTKCVSLNNQTWPARLVDVNPDERNNYPFMVSLDRCEWSCNIVEVPFGRIN